MLTVADLKALLESIPDDTPIVMQKDDEGNGYRYMRGLEFIPTGDNANYFDGSDECFRQSDLEDYGRTTEEMTLVAVAF